MARKRRKDLQFVRDPCPYPHQAVCSVHQLQCFTTNSVTAICSMSHAGTAGSRSRTWHVYIFFRFRTLVTSMEGKTCTQEMVAKLKRVDDQSVISWSNPLSLTHCYSIRFALTAIRSVPRMISSILPVTRKEATVGFTSKLFHSNEVSLSLFFCQARHAMACTVEAVAFSICP